MGKYIIKMINSTKQLVATNRINLRQHESLVDKIVFVVEYMYAEDIDLRDFNVALEWLDPTRVAHVDILEKEEEVYKENYQRYFIPVESPINRYAGDIEMKLVFTKVDYETSTRYKLESDTAIVPISTIKDYYAVLPNESFDAISDTIDRLQAMSDQLSADAELFFETKADNHMIDENGQLYLTAHGEKIGNGLNVVTPGTIDDEDGDENGVINLDDVYNDVEL